MREIYLSIPFGILRGADLPLWQNELAVSSSVRIELEEGMIPVSDIVRGITGILGLDPLTMGNEGKMIIAVPQEMRKKRWVS